MSDSQAMSRLADAMTAAAREMTSAAETMRRAASDFDYSLTMHQKFLNDWLERAENTLTEVLPEKGKPIEIEITKSFDNTICSTSEYPTIPSPSGPEPETLDG